MSLNNSWNIKYLTSLKKQNSVALTSKKLRIFMTFMLAIISSKLIEARKTYLENKHGLTEILLAKNSTETRFVAVSSEVIVKCQFNNLQWFKNNMTLKESSEILHLKRVSQDDAANYSCYSEVNNALGVLFLKVENVDSVTTNLPDSETFPKQVMQLNVLNPDEESHLDYLDQDKNIEQYQDPKNDANHDFHLLSQLKNEFAPHFKNAQKLFKLLSKPSGSFIQLPCPANGNPIPNITWTKDGQTIYRTMGKVTYKKWSINMEDLIPEDSGVYACKICNKYGCIEHSANLIINDRLRSRPILSEGYPQNQTALEYSTISLECKVISDLEPHIVWVTYVNASEAVEGLEKRIPNISNINTRNVSSEYPLFRKLKIE